MFKNFTMERDMNVKHEKHLKESTTKFRHRIGYLDVGDIDVGDIDVGDIDVGDIDVGGIDVGGHYDSWSMRF